MTRAALEVVTRCLAVTPQAPAWHEIDWNDVLVLANGHLLTPALQRALARRGDLDRVPGEVADYLAHLATANQQRNRMLLQQAHRLTMVLNGAGITPMFLKSAADLMSGAAVLSEDGIVGDLDLLVPPDTGPQAAAALIADGYQAHNEVLPNDHTYADLTRPGAAAMVDMHTAVLDAGRLLPAAEMWRAAESHCVDGARFVLPSPTERLRHRVMHDQVQERGMLTGRMRLSSAWRAAWLIHTRGGDMDWPRLWRQFGALRLAGTFGADLMAARMFGAAVPTVRSRAAKLTHRWRLVRIVNPKLRIPGAWLAAVIDRTIRLQTYLPVRN